MIFLYQVLTSQSNGLADIRDGPIPVSVSEISALISVLAVSVSIGIGIGSISGISKGQYRQKCGISPSLADMPHEVIAGDPPSLSRNNISNILVGCNGFL